MSVDKLQIINGHVYKLVENTRGVRTALDLVRQLRRDNHVLVRLVGDGSWAVYSRPRIEHISCFGSCFTMLLG
ncbi:MAG: hypothetical protein RTU09_00805 [Candidatus Thorarchaeota archaeon]